MGALVGIIMGSQSDWETMRHAADTLTELGIEHEVRIVSAHRTPDLLFEYASTAADRGLDRAGLPVRTDGCVDIFLERVPLRDPCGEIVEGAQRLRLAKFLTRDPVVRVVEPASGRQHPIEELPRLH